MRSRNPIGAASNACSIRPFRATPIPWLTAYARQQRERFGADLFPYGIEENRATWEQMALYTFQQGIAHRQFTPEEIFPQGIMTSVII